MVVQEGNDRDWRVRGSYFEACNCDAICPCRSVHGRPGGPSTHGVCYGTLSWQTREGHAGGIPGFDHPGTELQGQELVSTDETLRWDIRGRRHAAFVTDFDYGSTR